MAFLGSNLQVSEWTFYVIVAELCYTKARELQPEDGDAQKFEKDITDYVDWYCCLYEIGQYKDQILSKALMFIH